MTMVTFNLLVLTAELSDIFPISILVVCVGAMVFVLFKAAVLSRVLTDNTLRHSITSNNDIQVPRLQMTRVHIPFTFGLLEAKSNSFEGVQIAISSQVKYTLQAFWAVSIRELHMSLWQTWMELQDRTHLSTIINLKHCQRLAANMRFREPHSENVVVLKSVPSLVLGTPPRLVYPLVVFMIREPHKEELLHPDETAILVNVIHIRDSVCPVPTSVLAQYLKQVGGQLSCLQQLYLASSDIISTEIRNYDQMTQSLAETAPCICNGDPQICNSVPQDYPGTEHLCAVCHYFPISRALLPCRHTCICGVCFSKLDRCPMCRSVITNFFCTRTEEYIPADVSVPKFTSNC
ncbi:cell growth regulator with RING finger domain protein 1-like isoform X2 [Wyeomyia smithii]|uniref:cell growth regulator with RING finger domain protein 1-like isoform X2 n=1 Tax=Wyeomyia smithii TaxID=174621 RepID=UPI0024680A52|nr:cell growth regulator with RING finger domain protein 1-like isoform X2 [Wyeomyia smithii]